MLDPSTLVPMDVSSRLTKLQKNFDGFEVDALLLTNLFSIRYLTGFTGSAAMMVITPDSAVLTTDGRYKFQSVEQVESSGVVVEVEVGGLLAQMDSLKKAIGVSTRIGLEATNITWSLQRRFAETFSAAELKPVNDAVDSLRKIKDAGEIARMRAAAAIADESLVEVLDLLMQRPTEIEFGFALDTEIRRRTVDGNSFETIVATAGNGAKAHHQPADRVIEPGELTVLDFGAQFDGYCSDMTRTICVGEPKDPVLNKIVEINSRSQQAGVDGIKPGVPIGEVDDICRKIIADEGYGDMFLHSTGHGIGLEVHEAPYVSTGQTEPLMVGHVVTVEPGIYIEDLGGVRIEDTLVVTENGAEALTCYPKSWII